ncbi:MAG: ATP-binding protein [Candidatus Saccharimonadales bacterium]
MRTKKEQAIDERVKLRRSSVAGYFLTLVVFIVLSMLPTIIFGGFDLLFRESGPYVVFYMVYWAVVVAVVLAIISKQKQSTFDKPMKELSEAAKKVAEGDFSVYLAPRHTADRYDYIDVMFQDFNKMVQDLGSLETLKSDFIASVSHEIKTPLANIQSYSSALKTQKLTKSEQEDYINTIQESSEKLNNLVANILKLNRLENQTVELNIESYDLCRQLSECVLGFEKEINAKELKLKIDMDDRATIDADKSMLEMVWNNLLSNAVKFCKTGGTIAVKQTSTNNQVVVEISDMGIGMSEEAMRRVFEKFYQSDNSRSNEGNGLGLSLVGKVVDLVGGTITVESELNKGSKFTVKLNVYQDA